MWFVGGDTVVGPKKCVKRTGNLKLSLGVTATAIGWLSLVQGVTLQRQLGYVPAPSATLSADTMVIENG